MWVYTGDSLWHRLKLDRKLGFWLDYWLFLHGEDTHPIWSNRPLGMAAIAKAAHECTGEDRVLLEQLKREIKAAGPLLTYLPNAPPSPSTPLLVDSRCFTAQWLNWLQQVERLTGHDDFTVPMCASIAHALATGDYGVVGFLTRRLASELSANELSVNRLFQVGKYEICDSGNYDDRALHESELQQVISQMLKPPVSKTYNVELPLAPVLVSSTVAALRSPTRLIIDSTGSSRTLKGIRATVQASHVEEAALRAARETAYTLERLRLVFYVGTHFLDVVTVRDLEEQTEVKVPLPQPFWIRSGNRRRIPRLPSQFNSLLNRLSPEESKAWNSARWHLSQSFSVWAEDAHAAAAHIWQGLESFKVGAGGWRKVLGLAPNYTEHAAREMVEFLATRITSQSRALAKDAQAPDWYFWDANRVDLRKWLGRVLDKRSVNYYEKWKSPEAPQLAFHPDVGLLHSASRRLRGEGEGWMQKRVEADLRLLYGIRNKVVHTGRRVLPWQTAMHLGQLGAEVIFAMMAARVATLPSPVGQGAAAGAELTTINHIDSSH